MEPTEDRREGCGEGAEASERDAPSGARDADAAPTAELAKGEGDGAEPTGDTVRRPLVDAGGASDGAVAQGPAGGPLGWARAHLPVVAACAATAIVAVALLAVALVGATAVPDSARIEQDAREALSAPSYAGGAFGAGGPLVTSGVEVRSIRRVEGVPSGAAARPGASGYSTAEVVASYTGQGVSADQAATLSYALVDGTWELLGDVDPGDVAWRATTGVDQEKVALNVHLLLERGDAAEGWDGSDGLPTLAELYADSEAQVSSESFDEQAQTDVVELALERSGRYESYSCTLRASFSFAAASGRWELSGVEVSEGAREPDLSALVGTWEGTFQRQDTEGSTCLAGRASGLVVTVESASSDGGATISGTISGVAHYHAHPSQDSPSCEGDLPFDGVPFTARLVSDDEDSELAFSATLPEDVGGTVDVALGFGVDGAGQVVARVRTTYPHTASFLFIPYDETLVYTDVYTLTRS